MNDSTNIVSEILADAIRAAVFPILEAHEREHGINSSAPHLLTALSVVSSLAAQSSGIDEGRFVEGMRLSYRLSNAANTAQQVIDRAARKH